MKIEHLIDLYKTGSRSQDSYIQNELVAHSDKPSEALHYVYHAFLIFRNYNHKDKEIAQQDLKLIREAMGLTHNEDFQIELDVAEAIPLYTLLD